MMMFERWCSHHVPGWFDNNKDSLVAYDGMICVVHPQTRAFAQKIRRPAHHIGYPIASVKKDVTILPAGVLALGPSLPSVRVNDHGAWMASCGKDVLLQSVEPHAFPKGTAVCVRNGDYIIALGTILDAKEPSDRAVRLTTDVGKFLHR